MTSAASPWDFVPGTRVADYVIEERLAGSTRFPAWRATSGGLERVICFVPSAIVAADLANYPAHPGLASITEVIRDPTCERRGGAAQPLVTWTAIVSASDAGISLHEWLRDNPTASAPERLALLRMIASALDALHGAGLSHGNVTAATVLVTGSGTAVLTQPALVGEDAKPADILDFLRVAFTCLTGHEPTGDPQEQIDFGRLRAELLAAPVLRRRPMLAQQLAEAMVMPADARPTRLRRWLDHAASAGAAETVTGPTAAMPTRNPAGAPRSRGRLRALIFAAVAAAAVATTVTGVMVGKSHGAASSKKPPVTTSAAGAVTATAAWPMSPGCDDTTATALPDAFGVRANYGSDPRAKMVLVGGAAWQRGTLTITVHNGTGRPALLLGVDPHHYEKIVDPPAWVYRPSGVKRCPAESPPARSYVFDVDHWSMHSPDATPTNAQGPYLPIAAGEQVVLRVLVSNCTTNVRFVMHVRLAIDGSSTGTDLILPSRDASYTIDAIGDHTDLYTGTGQRPSGLVSSSCVAVHA